MRQASLALCALAGVVLAWVGCNSADIAFDLGLAGTVAAGEVRILDGAPDTVAITLQDTLKRRGLDAVIVKTRDTVVVESKTAAGLRFGLILTSRRAADGREQSQIALEWMDNRTDVQTNVQILSEIDRQGGKKN